MIKKVLNYFGTNSTEAISSGSPSIIKCPELSTSVKINTIDDPDFAWDVIKLNVQKEPYETLKLDTPVYDNKVKV